MIVLAEYAQVNFRTGLSFPIFLARGSSLAETTRSSQVHPTVAEHPRMLKSIVRIHIDPVIGPNPA
jgi:hypothetical protein